MNNLLLAVAIATIGLISNVFSSSLPTSHLERRAGKITPKVVIFSMFPPEADAWYGIKEFDVLAHNITVPGLSPLYPDAHCTANGDVCQVTIGEAGRSCTDILMSTSSDTKFQRLTRQPLLHHWFDIQDLTSARPTSWLPA